MTRSYEPILKNKVRILRPAEVKQLLKTIPKFAYVNMFETLLYTGMRYVEVKRLKENPQWFNGEFVKISVGEGIYKRQIRQKERWVRLTPMGRMAVRYYINSDNDLPSNVTWRENMRRWAKHAKIVPDGMCPKTTRKTWESWLTYYYGTSHHHEILMSQGHTDEIAIRHYLNLPFNEVDRLEMKEFMLGWI